MSQAAPCCLSYVGQSRTAHSSPLCCRRTACALNTFAARPITYQASSGHSQIDFVLARQHQAWGPARQAQTLSQFPVASWRGGGHHWPILAFVPWHKPQFQQGTQHRPVRCDSKAVNRALCENGPAVDAFRHAVQARLAAIPPENRQEVGDMLHEVCCQHFPQQPKSAPALPNENPAVQQPIQHAWQMRLRPKTFPFSWKAKFRSIMQVWKLATELARTVRSARMASKQVRKEQFESLIQQAEDAAAKGQHGELYMLVRRFAPHTKCAKVQLCNAQGDFLTHSQGLEALLAHSRATFTAQDWTWTGKAVLPGSAPTAAW